jgi:hypothetical protein
MQDLRDDDRIIGARASRDPIGLPAARPAASL